MGEAAPAVYQLFKDLDATTEAALRASIQRFGVVAAVVKDQHGDILDGHQRVRIADELGIDYPVNVREVADEAEAREIAVTLNEDRRAMPKAERLFVVAALKAEGHTNVAIGKALGVSEFTVRQDLKSMSSTIDIPETVTRKDGHPYPSHRPPEPAYKNATKTKKLPGLGRQQRLNADRVIARILTQVRGLPLVLDGLDFSGCQVDGQAIDDLTVCIRALSRLRTLLKEKSSV